MTWPRRMLTALVLATLAANSTVAAASSLASEHPDERTGRAAALAAGTDHRRLLEPATPWAAALAGHGGRTPGRGAGMQVPGDGIPPAPSGPPDPTREQPGPAPGGGAGDGRPPPPTTVAPPTPTPAPAAPDPAAPDPARSAGRDGGSLDRLALGLAGAVLLLVAVWVMGRWWRRRSGYQERHLEHPDDDLEAEWLGLDADGQPSGDPTRDRSDQ